MSLKPEQFPKPDVAWLREARERKGLTLDALASTTKITPKYLRALEAGDTDQLPPTFFTRGFVKVYAKEVGLDPAQTANRYLQLVTPEGATDGEDAAAIVATAVARTGGVAFEQDDTAHLHQGPGQNRVGRLTLAAAMVGLVVYVGPFNWDGWSSKVAASGVAAFPSADAVAPAATPAPAVEAAPTPVAADLPGGLMQFEMNPTGPCWFSAAADGNQVRSELLQAGNKRPMEARDEIVLRLGDPEACEFSINGRAGHAPGAAGMPVTVRITKDNFRSFLAQ
jgi:hypothetical protein